MTPASRGAACSDVQRLCAAVDAILPGATLRLHALPQVPALQLLLLDERATQRRLSAEDMQRVMENPLYWVFCWASGQVLAAHLLDDPETVRGRRVVDFGCGSGVVGIAAAMAGAGEVLACDSDPLARAATAYNARVNGVSLQTCADFASIEGEIDLLIAADVLYDRDNLPWLQRFAERAGAVLVADSRIRDFAVPAYVRVAERACTTLPDLDEAREFNRVAIYAAGCALSGGPLT